MRPRGVQPARAPTCAAANASSAASPITTTRSAGTSSAARCRTMCPDLPSVEASGRPSMRTNRSAIPCRRTSGISSVCGASDSRDCVSPDSCRAASSCAAPIVSPQDSARSQ
ncbi:hypothetical protein STANM309S_00294 [Streptomyces tanashiensis]